MRLKADDDVSEIFKMVVRPSPLGYIGIHEPLTRAVRRRTPVREAKAARAKGIAIVERLRRAVDQ